MVFAYYFLDALVFFGMIIAIHYLRQKQRKLPPLPPGPKGWPIIGNMFQLPQSKQWEVYKAWSDQYG
jgi:hypothetical protein